MHLGKTYSWFGLTAKDLILSLSIIIHMIIIIHQVSVRPTWGFPTSNQAQITKALLSLSEYISSGFQFGKNLLMSYSIHVVHAFKLNQQWMKLSEYHIWVFYHARDDKLEIWNIFILKPVWFIMQCPLSSKLFKQITDVWNSWVFLYLILKTRLVVPHVGTTTQFNSYSLSKAGEHRSWDFKKHWTRIIN